MERGGRTRARSQPSTSWNHILQQNWLHFISFRLKRGNMQRFSALDGSSCCSRDNLNILEVKKPTIPDKPKHIDNIRRKVWIKQKKVQTEGNIREVPSKSQSNVSSNFVVPKICMISKLNACFPHNLIFHDLAKIS